MIQKILNLFKKSNKMDSIDLVYSLGIGSHWDNNELRYSLRSVEKFAKNVRNIYIVGEFPNWLTNCIHLTCNEDSDIVSHNIAEKIYQACKDDRVSEQFMVMNDDYFFIQEVDCLNYPYYYKNTLENEAQLLEDGNPYGEYVFKTYNCLVQSKLGTKNFDTHVPIIINKIPFISLFGKMNFKLHLLVRSLYCNINLIKGELLTDCKINTRMRIGEIEETIKNRKVFSIGDLSLNSGFHAHQRAEMKQFLEMKFPNKSKYEL